MFTNRIKSPRLRYVDPVDDDKSGGGTDTSNQPGATPDGSLGDAGKAALAAERKRANDAERELAAFRKKEKDASDKELTESQRLARELETERAATASLQRENLKYRVASQIENFPLNLVGRLQGDDEAAIKADADALVKQFGVGAPRVPKADPSAGKRTNASGLSNAEQFESAVDTLFDNQ